uniref:Uncharacterized protein n=1 Tax=Anguilla anguilla TaxID=7936 RepID=A0A0E9QZF1_ANGAN
MIAVVTYTMVPEVLVGELQMGFSRSLQENLSFRGRRLSELGAVLVGVSRRHGNLLLPDQFHQLLASDWQNSGCLAGTLG